MSDVELYEPRVSDAPAIAAFVNGVSVGLYGENEIGEDEVRHWFALPRVTFRLARRGGEVVGYADYEADSEEGSRWNLDIRTRDPQVAEALLADAERHARAGTSADVIELHGYAPEEATEVAGVYFEHGFEHVRSSYEMRIELPADAASAPMPEGLEVRTFRPDDEEAVYEAQQESFEENWGFRRRPFDEWRQSNLERDDFDPSLWYLAVDGAEVAGVALCGWHHSGDPKFGWVNMLGVRRPWRKRGLGLALLARAFADFDQRGATRVGLGVDAESTTGAVRLYERAGMSVAHRSNQYRKRL